MAEVWRDVTADEKTTLTEADRAPWGTFRPNLLQNLLIGLGRRTVLKRGVFRGGYTRWIFRLGGNRPLDVRFRECCYRLRGQNNLLEYGILLNPAYNGSDLDFLLDGAPQDAVFLDIGSNIGLYTQPMAKAASQGRVISIDANPLMMAHLKLNADATGLTNVEMVQSAVSDVTGAGVLKIRKDDVAIVAIEEVEGGEIPVRRLDDILSDLNVSSVFGLKIDIEGHEEKALVPYMEAATDAMLPNRIVIEHPSREEDYAGCAAVFAKRGYTRVGRSRNNSFYERHDG